MIERSEFIESIEAWCDDRLATANDLLLGAFVTLRLITSLIFKLLGCGPRGREGRPLQNMESLLTLITGRIEEWENRWMRAIEAKTSGEIEGCHPFLLQYYGTHSRLQLFSLPLQDLLASGNPSRYPSLEIIWVAFSSAMDMLQLIPRYSSRLCFVQDSIHVMTAYGATFLIKVRHHVPVPHQSSFAYYV